VGTSTSASVYDLVYAAQGKDYAAEAAELRAQIDARVTGARSVLDVACGTGAHLAHLRQWYEVAGIDVDHAMLAEARAKLPGVDLREADMRTLQLDRRFDAVMCLFSAIGYLRDPGELDAAVATMAAHLVPGGVLVVDGWVRPERWRGDATAHAVTADGDGITVVRLVLARRDGRTTRLDMHHLLATPAGVEHLVDVQELTLFEAEEYEHAFRAAGLTLEVVPSPMPDRDRYVGTAPRT
jgi:SAM-dependent methyltransferase